MPDWSGANPYQKLLAAALERSGCKVTFRSYSNSLFPIFAANRDRIFSEKKVIHLHWLTEIIMRTAWSKKPLVFWLKYICLACDLLVCRLLGFRLVWTIHNKYAHEELNKGKELIIRRMYAYWVHECVVHSGEALAVLSKEYEITWLKNKTQVAPHGNYIGAYPSASDSEAIIRKSLGFADNTILYLFVGAIKPYKGVEKFVDAANSQAHNDNVAFVLAGEPKNNEYKKEILSKIKTDKIRCTFNYLAEQDLVDFLTIANAVILPFSDSLTSGSAILASSYKKALILPALGRVFGIFPQEYDLFFNSKEELLDIINNKSQEQLRIEGNNLHETIKKHSWDNMASLTKATYSKKRKA